MNRDRLLLEAISEANAVWFGGDDAPRAFEPLVRAARVVTGSQHAAVAEVVAAGADGVRLEILAPGVPAPVPAARAEDIGPRLERALRAVVQEGRALHLPAGSGDGPAFLGLPRRSGEAVVGALGLVSPADGVGLDAVAALAPFLSACASLIAAARARRQRLLALAELQASEERYRDLVENSGDLICTHDLDGVILTVNAAMLRVTGHERDELVGAAIPAFLAPDVRHRFGDYLAALRRDGRATGLMHIVTRGGDRRILEFDNSLRTHGLPHPIVRGLARDVTEQIRSQEALRASEERYRLLVEHSLQGVYIHAGGVIRLANPAMARLHGYADPAELVGQPYWIVIAPDERARIEGYRLARLRGEPVPSTYEARNTTKDGRVIWVQNSATVVPWEGGEALMVTFVDITERKRAEEALIASQERLALAVGGADLGTWDWNIVTGEVVISDRWATMLGWEPGELAPAIGTWQGLVHPEDRDPIMRVLQEHLDGRTPFYHAEHRLRTRAGDWKWILTHGRVVARDGAGQPLRAAGIHQDISARKEVELALRKSHDDLLEVLNQLRVAVAVIDADGRLAFLSEPCAAIEGLDADRAVGQPWDAVLHFDDRSRAQVRETMELPAAQRTRLPLRMEPVSGRVYHLECDVGDDPRDGRRRILYLYDVTEIHRLRARLDVARHGQMVGAHPAMLRLFQAIERVARGAWTVLIEGETGVGKELVARAIHAASPRRHGPFVAVNCAGLTESLLASQLFGHRKGAFTGAVTDQEGLVEAASGGTLFLDEIGDLPASVQTALLRVLQEREITRLGESRPRTVDVRVLAATHRDLAREAAEGRFRPDLLYRVRVARVSVPPLRERVEDIPLLVSAFLAETRVSAGKPMAQVSAATMQILQRYAWPGNVRELRHAVEHAVIHGQGQIL